MNKFDIYRIIGLASKCLLEDEALHKNSSFQNAYSILLDIDTLLAKVKVVLPLQATILACVSSLWDLKACQTGCDIGSDITSILTENVPFPPEPTYILELCDQNTS